MERVSSDRTGLWLALILLSTLAVYTPSLRNGFTYDDRMYVMTDRPGQPANVMVESVRPLHEYFSRQMGYDAMQAGGRGFRPTTVLSYAVVHALSKSKDASKPSGYKDEPWLQHLLNVLLHVACVWIVYHLVRFVSGPGWPPLVGALAFGLQPLHTDVVAGIVGRGELLPFVLCGFATLLYVRAAERTGTAKWVSVAFAIPCMFFGLCSKESAITWCVFAPLFAWSVDWRRHPESSLLGCLRLQLPRIWVIAVPAALWAVLYLRFLGLLTQEFAVPFEFNPLYYLSLFERLPVAVMVMAYGVAKVFFSFTLSIDYGHAVFPLDVGWSDWRVLVGFGFLVGLLGVGLGFARRFPLLFLGVAALLGFSFVTSNIPVPIETIFGERLYFTASLGLSFLFAWLAKRPPRSVVLQRALIVVLIAWCAWGAKWCVERSLSWYSNDTMMFADIEHQPRSLSLNKAMASHHQRNNNVQQWLRYMERCLELDPDYINALTDIGAHYLQSGRLELARPYLSRAEQSLQKRPRYLSSDGDRVYLNVGRYHLIRGDRGAAATAFRRSRELNVRNPYSRNHLLMLAHEDRNEAFAAELLRDYELYQPTRPKLQMHRGLQAYRAGRYDQAAILLFESVFEKQAAKGRQEMLVTWWAMEDCLARLGRKAERAKLLNQMLEVFQEKDRGRVRARLQEIGK